LDLEQRLLVQPKNEKKNCNRMTSLPLHVRRYVIYTVVACHLLGLLLPTIVVAVGCVVVCVQVVVVVVCGVVVAVSSTVHS